MARWQDRNVWGLGLTAGQLLMLYALRPGGALMSVVAHLVVPAWLIGLTISWGRGATPDRLARMEGGPVGLLWVAWLVAVGVLLLWPLVWQTTTADPILAEAFSGTLRRLAWFGLIPALFSLMWLTWKWFGAHENRG